MSTTQIRHSIQNAVGYLTAHPETGKGADGSVTAVLTDGLCCRAAHSTGVVVVTDMPPAVGGGGSAPTPGWFLRAALATCDATVIAMRAALDDVQLTTLEVTVASESDDRGLLGVDDSVAPGPLFVRVHVRIASESASNEHLRAIVAWAERHSPVADAMGRAVPAAVEIETA